MRTVSVLLLYRSEAGHISNDVLLVALYARYPPKGAIPGNPIALVHHVLTDTYVTRMCVEILWDPTHPAFPRGQTPFADE